MREESYVDFCSSAKIQTNLVRMVKYRIHLQYILF